MWEEGTSNPKGASMKVFNELMQECKHSAPGARLSARLRTALERMPPTERRAVCSRTRDGCAPLFVACRRGNVELVEYLVHVCDADLEQRGVYEVPHDRSTHSVTPLWCAAVAGRLPVLRALADAGAELDAASDSGSTPVRSACFMTHVDAVRLLLERGADLHRPNHNGGTCLINAVQSVPLCALLLDHGARPDHQDMQLKTALHYAVQEHRLETARLLLERGADPHLRSRSGDDALRTACLKGATQIVELLVSRVQYNAERVADAYELLGATQLDEFNDVHAALAAWRHATAIRHAHGQYIEKRNWEGLVEWSLCGGGGAAMGGAREWRTPAELAALAADVDALRAAALLIAVRVLGAHHKDTVFRLMYRGAAYADAFRYQRCIDLWMWALEIRIEKDSLLYSDTCQTASALTRLLLDARSGRLEHAAEVPRGRDVLRAFRLLADALPEARAALRPRPVHRRQADNYDRALRCASHLLHLLACAPYDADAAPPPEVAAAVRALVAADVRSASTGDTLLHLCVSRLNVVRSTYFADESAGDVFPSAAAVRLLLRCGADPLARNEARSTALHVAAVPYNYTGALVAALLDAGAHLDTPNRFGDRAADLVLHNRAARLRPLRYVSLRCLAARALLAAHPDPLPPGLLPVELERFLDLHRP